MTILADSGMAPAICLDEVLHLPAARPLAEAIASLRGTDLTLDASKVRNLGAQCAQILVAAVKAWRVDGRSLRIVEATPSFNEGAHLLGLGTFFSDLETAQ